MRPTTPRDTSRVVDLEILLGNRGASGDRAVRHRELRNIIEQAISTAAKNAPSPRTEVQVLASDLATPTAGAWVSGPSITLGKGIWMVSGSVLVRTSLAATIAARLFNGTTGIRATQASAPALADYFTTLTLSGAVVIDATTTLTLQAAPSVSAGTTTMIAQTTIGGALPATRLTAVQIGA